MRVPADRSDGERFVCCDRVALIVCHTGPDLGCRRGDYVARTLWGDKMVAVLKCRTSLTGPTYFERDRVETTYVNSNY